MTDHHYSLQQSSRIKYQEVLFSDTRMREIGMVSPPRRQAQAGRGTGRFSADAPGANYSWSVFLAPSVPKSLNNVVVGGVPL